MNNPQLSRKEKIQKGCGKKGWYPNYLHIECGKLYIPAYNNYLLCPTCQARLDERIRAEQDFLKMIDEQIKMWESDNKEKERYYGTSGCVVKVLEELKSTIKQETKE
jgi:hypothetical protein